MRVLVVDDEAPARKRLIALLEEFPEVEVMGEARDGREALIELERTRPDLLLLDIAMPELDGLSLAARFADLPPIVFVTAHDEHAVKAFELHAVDYLLKPVRRERLADTLRRVPREGARLPWLHEVLPAAAPSDAPRIVVQERGAIRLFDAPSVTRFHATDKYTAFLHAGAEQLTEEPLSVLEQRLQKHGFLRVHRAELVRLSAIRALRFENGIHELELDDGQTARVSRRSVALLKRMLGL